MRGLRVLLRKRAALFGARTSTKSKRHSRNLFDFRIKLAVLGFTACVSGIAMPAHARLQCVPYAREHSGIDIHGNANTWWRQAEGTYKRGNAPKVGAVIAMASSKAMPFGHVGVVRKIVGSREILIDHANWSAPGLIEQGVLVRDVSPEGDWSVVRVWYGPSQTLGSRTNAIAGFIYPYPPSNDAAPTTILAMRTANEPTVKVMVRDSNEAPAGMRPIAAP